MSAPALELDRVSVPFGPPEGPWHEGLHDLSLALAPGERFALLGASGVGKSSLLTAIAEPHPGVRGSIRIGGRDAGATPPRERGAILLDQRPLLFPHLDVAGNVAFPLKVRGAVGTAVAEGVEKALAAVRMEGFARRSPGSLSGGQAHRVALARAIAAGPELLLLDEPFTGLEPELRATLQQTVVQVAADRGIAVVTVTHDPEEAGRIADRIGVLEGGRLARVARPRDLFLDPGSEAVARLLGWPNRLEVRKGRSGIVLPGGALVDGVHTDGVEGAGWLVFPADGAEAVDARVGHLQVTVVRVSRSPRGAVAHWALDLPGPAESSTGGAPPEPVTGEVAVNPLHAPVPGDRIGLRLNPERVRIYPRVEDDPHPSRSTALP